MIGAATLRRAVTGGDRSGASARPARRGRRLGARRRGDQGSVLVELALALPLLLTICLGTLDLGLGWRADLTVSGATRAGARVGASQGVVYSADYNILLNVGAALGTIPSSEIDRIIVYKATSAAGTVPSNCLTAAVKTAGGSASDYCNVYSSTDLATVLASPSSVPSIFPNTACTTGTVSHRDRFWCPSSRDNTAGTGGAGLDYLGIYIVVNHATVTKLFGATLTITDQAVMRIEPGAGNP